ncbi:CDP-alcohol phosphatidyltransferase family protein [Sporolactobacillus sp. CPB3-1]|uniref:Phosphatidylglycerophosphate synthase n=1 Tax=Sporolactobacillus mangiferae TaxID=2940498 RepID=A0ABT0MD66_9BACL|nr:CDP-alcohol phosphatidyltransferase family protein [Sporolactobacillus mangiferae]MCL1632819.1 CDP-alcohol phosphatidyltransferase family protein [Sporolactobacillus mangiferae]
MKYIPNMLTVSRIIFVLLLPFCYQNSRVFAALYVAAGLTDFLDGQIARKISKPSRLGARLDSLADFIMYGVLCILFLILAWDVLMPFVPLIGFITGFRLLSLSTAAYKYRSFVSVHTWGNKMAGVLLFAAPAIYILFRSNGFLWGAGIIALLSAVEEWLIHLTSGTADENRRSLFFK